MASQWYYSVNGQSKGPFTEDQLIEIFHGANSPGKDALIFGNPDTNGQWCKVTDIDGLLPAPPAKKSLLPSQPAPRAEPPPLPGAVQAPGLPAAAATAPKSRLPLILGIAAAVVLGAGLLYAGFQYAGKAKAVKPKAEAKAPAAPKAVAPAKPVVAEHKPEPKKQGPKEGEIQLPGGLGLEMLPIPAGSFVMGSSETEAGHKKDENQHRVTLTHKFWLGKTEVTQAQWKALMGALPEHPGSNFRNKDDMPAESINYYAAIDFCNKLNELEKSRIPAGYQYRLPTEAEWEYACRAGSDKPYGGQGDIESMSWYGNNSKGTTHPVAQKSPNAWGLYDMHGNVYEWCWELSCGEPYPEGAATDPFCTSNSNPNSILRRTRGGCFCGSSNLCRSAARRDEGAQGPSLFVGFRVALAPIPPAGVTPPAAPKPTPPPPRKPRSR